MQNLILLILLIMALAVLLALVIVLIVVLRDGKLSFLLKRSKKKDVVLAGLQHQSHQD